VKERAEIAVDGTSGILSRAWTSLRSTTASNQRESSGDTTKRRGYADKLAKAVRNGQTLGG
jgi:hypothetical protein